MRRAADLETAAPCRGGWAEQGAFGDRSPVLMSSLLPQSSAPNSLNKPRCLGLEVGSQGRTSFWFGVLCHIPGSPCIIFPLGDNGSEDSLA
jgi:hypothetical protein